MSEIWQYPYVDIFKSFNLWDWKNAKKAGEVVEDLDSAIGRKILTITGTVPSNNFVTLPKPQAEMKSLALKGRYVYLCIRGVDAKPFAVHLEFNVSGTVRVSLSNMFKEESYDKLTIHIPLKLKEKRWTVVCLDSKELLRKHGCIKDIKEKSILKTLTICANIKVSKVVTSDKLYDPATFPKELNFKCTHKESWLDKYDWIEPLTCQRPIVEPVKVVQEPLAEAPPKKKKEKELVVPDKSEKEQLEEQARYTIIKAKSEETKAKFLQKVMGKENFPSDLRSEESLRSSLAKPVKMEKDTLLQLKNVIGATVTQCPSVCWSRTGEAKEIIYASGGVIVIMDVSTEGQRLLKGHESSVKALAMGPKGDILASCEDKVIKVWDVKLGKCLATWNAQGYISLSNITISPDSNFLATAGLDPHKRDVLTVWDLRTLSQINAYQPFPAILARQLSPYQIQCLKFGPDLPGPEGELQLCSCGKENIRFWRIKKRALKGISVVLNQYSRNTFFTCLEFESKEKVYVGSKEGRILQVNADTQELEYVFQLHEAGINSLAACEAFCVTGSDDMYLRVWPLDFSEFFMEAKHESLVQSVAISPDNSDILCATENSTIGVLDIPNQKYRTLIRSHTSTILAMDALKNNLVTVSLDKTIRVWDVGTMQQVYEFSSPEDQATCIAIHFDKPLFVCGFRSGTIRIFDLNKTSVTDESQLSEKAVVTVKYLSKAGLLIAIAEDGGMGFFNANTHQLIKQLPLDIPTVYTGLAVLQSEQLFATIGSNATSILIWDSASLNKIITIPVAGCQVRDIAMRSANLQLLAVTSDSQLRVFTLDGKVVGKYPLPEMDLGPLKENVRMVITQNGKYATLYGFDKRIIQVPLQTTVFEPAASMTQTQQFPALEMEEYAYHTIAANTAIYHPENPALFLTAGGAEGIFLWNFQGDTSIPAEGDLPPAFSTMLRRSIPLLEPKKTTLRSITSISQAKKPEPPPTESQKLPEIRESIRVSSSLALPLRVEEEKLSVAISNQALLNKENMLILKKSEINLPSKHFMYAEAEQTRNPPFTDPEGIVSAQMILGYNGHAHDNIIWNERAGWVAFTVCNKLVVEGIADKVQEIFLEQEADISTITLSKDKAMFATASGTVESTTQKPIIMLYNVDEVKPTLKVYKKLITTHGTGVQAIEFVGNHKFLCSIGCYPENVLMIWNCSLGTCVYSEVLRFPVNDLKVDFNDDTLLSWTTVGNNEIILWEIEPGVKPKVLKRSSTSEAQGTFSCLAQTGFINSENSRLFLIGTTEGSVLVYNPMKKRFVGEYPVFEGQISCISVKEKSIIIAGTSDTIVRWNLPEVETVHPNLFVSKPNTMTLDSHVVAMSFDENGIEGQVGTDLGTIWYINWLENASIRLHSGHLGSTIKCIGNSTKAQVFVTAADDDTVKVWSTDTCDQLATFEIPNVESNTLAIHENLCVSGFVDGNIRFFSLKDLKNLGKAKVSEAEITALTVSPLGATIFVGDALGDLYLVGIESLEPLSVKTQKLLTMEGVFSIDAQKGSSKSRFLAASGRRTIKVWEKTERVAVMQKTQDPFGLAKDWEFVEIDAFPLGEEEVKEFCKTFAAFSKTEESTVVCCTENVPEIVLRNVDKKQFLKRIKISELILCFALTKDYAAVGGSGGVLEIVYLRDGRTKKARVHGGKIEAIYAKEEGDELFTGSYGELIKWKISSLL